MSSMSIRYDEFHNFRTEINRGRIRFVGIGPKLAKENNGKTWPLNAIDPVDEVRKVLDSDITNLINNTEKCDNIRKVIHTIFERLKRCNIRSLFDKYCPLDEGHFSRAPFDIAVALDCYTTSGQILKFIHHVIASIDKGKSSEINFNRGFLKFVFGCDRNYNIFKRHINELVSRGEKFRKFELGYYVKFHDLAMNLDRISWLDELGVEAKFRVFIQTLFGILKYILELLRRYFYITLGTHYGEKLFYFRYDLWQRIQHKTLQQLIKQQVLSPVPMPQLDKKSAKKSISKIRFHVKKDNLRLICTSCRLSDLTYRCMIVLLRYLLLSSPNYTHFNLMSLLSGLRYFNQRKTEHNETIYFVRADIKDCFQSIDQQLLFDIVVEKFNTDPANTDGCIYLNNMTCQTRRRRTVDGTLRKSKHIKYLTMDDAETVRQSGRFLTVFDKVTKLPVKIAEFSDAFLKPHIIKPIVRPTYHSKQAFVLSKGIRQGAQASSVLNSIYVQAAFDRHLGDFYASPSCRIYCYVDDILFISTNLAESQSFMHKMLVGFSEFGLKMNVNKLKSNFSCRNLDEKKCRLEKYVIFYKQLIELATLKCSYDYNYNDMPMQDTFTLNPYASTLNIDTAVKMVRIDFFHLDMKLSGFDRVVTNIYERGVMVAHRVASYFILSLYLKNLKNQKPKFLLELIKDFAKRICLTIKLAIKRGLVENDLSYRQIRLVIAAAFLVSWQRPGVRHRKEELHKLTQLYRRLRMRYLIAPEVRDFQREYWAATLTRQSSRREFSKTKLAKQFELPHSMHRKMG